ncbi:MAG: phosphatidylserine/phosphatidylglycerophosphate/cardiolipin synthase family protein [Cyanobacteria bacterium K_DeepCast_35m_m2_155]|nr:phosphatidylserine/phosphatidylglycerophosphate/cardiolipin synthase family protein [Cyanobacteria bacterium K_DeepCast_35m_m2_155]
MATVTRRARGRCFSVLGLVGALLLSSCHAQARLEGQIQEPLPQAEGIEVAFNHNPRTRYRSPIHGEWRRGDDLEAFVLASIEAAQSQILVAVQELSLPKVAAALVRKHQQGLDVRVVLENTYSTPWSLQHDVDLSPHLRRRNQQLRQLGWGDAVLMLQQGGVPMLDDTADGSAGSGLMHHKFMVIDAETVVTGSANFTPSCIHGDPEDSRTRGNVNHLLRLHSADLAEVFTAEFERLWGDGPGGAADSRFGIAKGEGQPHQVMVQGTPVQVLFAPHRRNDPNNGLLWLETLLAGSQNRVDLNLFVFSAQNLSDTLQQLQRQGVALRVLADPGFANRSFSETLDLMGISMADHRCRLEAGNKPWQQGIAQVGTPNLRPGDKLHHKVAILDDARVITGSFNWSPSAAHQNDETLLVIDSPQLAAHFRAEMDHLWRNAELGISQRLERKLQRQQLSCGSGTVVAD